MPQSERAQCLRQPEQTGSDRWRTRAFQWPRGEHGQEVLAGMPFAERAGRHPRAGALRARPASIRHLAGFAWVERGAGEHGGAGEDKPV